MSRKTRQIEFEARERWPQLFQFCACYLGQDHVYEFGTLDAAVDRAVSDYDDTMLKNVAIEWWDWNISRGSHEDPRDWIGALGVNRLWDGPQEARALMNSLYDKVIAQIRQNDRYWRPGK